jgi:hypothetical protein
MRSGRFVPIFDALADPALVAGYPPISSTRTGALGLIAVDRPTWCNEPPGRRLGRDGAIAQNP